jgi:hypothetical protein
MLQRKEERITKNIGYIPNQFWLLCNVINKYGSQLNCPENMHYLFAKKQKHKAKENALVRLRRL